jgi:hypothetical protein
MLSKILFHLSTTGWGGGEGGEVSEEVMGNKGKERADEKLPSSE